MKSILTRHRVILVLVPFFLLLAGLISMGLLTNEWLKNKLEQKAAASGVELKIKSLTFSPFKSWAALSGIEYRHKKNNSDRTVNLDAAEVRFSLWELPFRIIHITSLELKEPRIVSIASKLSEPPSKGTMDKLKRFAQKKWEDLPKDSAPKRTRWTVDRVRVTQGAIDHTIIRQGREPLPIRITDINYTANNIAIDSLDNLFFGVDLHAVLHAGGKLVLDKRGSAPPYTFTVKNIDLAYADRFLDQTDALTLTGGKMDLTSVADGLIKNRRFEARIIGLELTLNKNAAGREFMFIPAERLINYVTRKKGNLVVAFTLSDEKFEKSSDLEYLAKEFWNGLLTAIIKEIDLKKIRTKDE